MENIFKEIDITENISVKTKKNLKDTVKSLVLNYPQKSIKVFNDPSYIKSIADKKPISSKHKLYSDISSIYKKCAFDLITIENKKIFEIERKKASDGFNDNRKKQDFSIKYTWGEITNLLNTYDEDSIEYLFLATSIMIPPRRRDWEHAIFVETMPVVIDKTKNYVIMGENAVSLEFYNSKVFKYTGVYKTTLKNENYPYMKHSKHFNPRQLSNLLKKSYNDDDREKVFNYRSISDRVYKRNSLDFDLNQDEVRHSFSQYIWSLKNITNQNLKQITKDFGDVNVETFRSYDTVKSLDIVTKKNIEPKNEIIKTKDYNEYLDDEILELEKKINDLKNARNIYSNYKK